MTSGGGVPSSEYDRRRLDYDAETKTGWPIDGGRPYGHPDDVMSPLIRATQLLGRIRRDERPRPLWFKITRVVFVVLIVAFLLQTIAPIIAQVIDIVRRLVG